MASSARTSYSSNVGRLKAQFALARKAAVLRAANEWRNGVISEMTESTPSGKVYPVPGTQRSYRASAPGEPPAIRTGLYRASWRVRPIPISVLGADAAEVGTNAVQARRLEKGDEDLAPRPHVRQGYERNRAGVYRALTQRWDGIGGLLG